jgi:hypothetical protein
VGVATDLGRPTAGIRHALRDATSSSSRRTTTRQLLRAGSLPPSVQARIASSHGHLSNHAAARFLVELLHPGLAGVLLAHLSGGVQRPGPGPGGGGWGAPPGGWSGWLGVADQDEPTELLDVRPPAKPPGTRGQLSLL